MSRIQKRGSGVRLADCPIKLGNRIGQLTRECNGTIIKRGSNPQGSSSGLTG